MEEDTEVVASVAYCLIVLLLSLLEAMLLKLLADNEEEAPRIEAEHLAFGEA